ncbi:MAG: hypothetical protein M3Y08_15995 [Fibrobacterota bacterium]|nr:hypothetical protein [Fibrobacterota bacterium]
MHGTVLMLFFVCLSFVFLHCLPGQVAGGAGAGNPPSPQAEISLSVLAYAKSAPAQPKSTASPSRSTVDALVTVDSVGSIIALDSIRLSAASIDIDMPPGVSCLAVENFECAENEVSLPGPFEMELVTGTTVPKMNILRLPKGSYTRFGLEPREWNGNAGFPANMDSTNFSLWGSVSAPGKAPIKFALRVYLEDGIDFTNPIGLIAKSDSLNRMVLSLQVNGWFAGTDLVSCLESEPAKVDSLGVLRVSGNAVCGGLGKRMSRNVDGSGGLEDEDEMEE